MITIDADLCLGCRLCAAICPAAALALIHDQYAIVSFEERCIECMLCEQGCPEDAIKIYPINKKTDCA